MILTAQTHPGLYVRDDTGSVVNDVDSIDTDEMSVTIFARDKYGHLIMDRIAGCIVTRTFHLRSYRFEPNNVIRVQLGQEITP